ncbi:MAG: PDZ domain-containing protein [Clostridia bacterium]|nr:PDZ domain-containing protein [Deltaproteobacteria bacterium]
MRIHSAFFALGLAAFTTLAPARSSAISDNDRISALEQQLAVLQREISNFEARGSQAVSPKVAAASSPSGDSLTWLLADSALGIEVNGITVNDTTYSVQRDWLTTELVLLRLPGRALTFAPVPGGVAVRLVKPKTLAAKLGLQNGDTIIAIDDKAVQSVDDISAALHAAKGGQTKVKLLRKKREAELTYKLVD